MYDFLFYFFYGFFRKRPDGEGIFNAVLATSLIILVHIGALWKLLAVFHILPPIPRFSDTYVYNKLYWYIPIAPVFGLILLYFSKSRTKAIIKKYGEKEDFYSFGNVLLFLLMLGAPIAIIAALNGRT